METSHSYSPEELARRLIGRLQQDPEQITAEEILNQSRGHCWNEICALEEELGASLEEDLCEKAIELIEFVPARWVLKVKQGEK